MDKCFLCIEVGGTNFRYGIVNFDLSLNYFKIISTNELSNSKDKIMFFVQIIKKMIDKVGQESVDSICIALPSTMDKERRKIYSSPMIIGFNNLNIVDELEKEFKIPVFIEKDVNILLLYEINKLKIKCEGIISGIFLGTGIGNAIAINGEIYKGASGTACELGHIIIPDSNKKCDCGKKGCVETYSSGKILNNLANQKYNCHVSEIFELYGDKDDVKKILYYMATAISTEICILDPEYIILGGGIIFMPNFPYKWFINTIIENVRYPYPQTTINITKASNDAYAGLIGGAIYLKSKMS